MNFNLNTWIAVGGYLTGDWSVGYLAGREDSAVLLRRDGLQLVASTHYDTPAGKVSLRLSMNGGEWDHKRYSETIPSINVSPDRKAATLARDIERRLIPAAEEFREVILERAARADEHQRKVDAAREQLLATGAVDEPGPHFADRLYLKRGVGLYGHVTHGDGYVSFDLNVSAEDAVAMLALLAERSAK